MIPSEPGHDIKIKDRVIPLTGVSKTACGQCKIECATHG